MLYQHPLRQDRELYVQPSWLEKPVNVGASQVGPVRLVVPHRGALPETRESYRTPIPPLGRHDHLGLLTVPWRGLHWDPALGIHSVPGTYRTENSQYGSFDPTLG